MIKRWIKRMVIFIGILAFLLVAFLIFLHTGAGKSMVRQKAVSFLEKKWKTTVSIGNIDYRLPNWILLERVTILDREKDTLLNAGHLYVEVKMLKLLSNVVDVSGLRLEDVSLRCQRGANDSAFNFQFVLDAFAPAENTKKNSDTSGAPLRLSVKRLSMSRIKLELNDYHAQSHLSAFIGELSILPDTIDLVKSSFAVNDLTLKDSKVTLIDSSVKKEVSATAADTSSGTGTLLLALKQLHLQNVFFAYDVPATKSHYAFRVDSLAMQQASLDLNRRSVRAKSFGLSHTNVQLAEWSPKTTTPKRQQPIPVSNKNQNDWSFAVQSISFDNDSFGYHNNALPEIKGLDLQHIDLKNIHLQTQENRFDSSGLYAGVGSLSLKYNDQLNVNDISTTVYFSDSLLHLKDLKTSISQSQLTTTGDIVLPLKQGMQKADKKFAIQNSAISYGDLLLIVPALKNQLPLSLLPSDKILLSGKFSGTIQNLKGEQINLACTNRQFLYQGNVAFQMKHGPKINTTVQRLMVNKNILSKTLLSQLQKQNIFLPAEIMLSGETQIDAGNCLAKLKLNSEFGNLQIDGNIQNFNSPQHIKYNVKLGANDFHAGKWIGLDSVLGKINGHIIIDGKGLSKNNIAASAGIQLQSAVVNGYSYANIDMHAQMEKSSFNIHTRIGDQNLRTELRLGGIVGQGLSAEGTMQIEKADLFRLGLTSDSITCAGNLSIKGNYHASNLFDVLVQLDSGQLFVGEKQYEADQLSIQAKTNTDTVSIIVNAPYANFQLSGNYSANALPAEISSIWRNFSVFNTAVKEDKRSQGTSNHNTSFDSWIIQGDLISAFFPALEVQDLVTIHGRFHKSPENSFQSLQLFAPAIKYNDYEAEDLKLEANSAGSGTQFSLSTSNFSTRKKQFGNTRISGNMQNNLLAVRAITNDSLDKEVYAAHMQLKKENDEMVISLPGDLVLNYNRWKLSSGNSIHIRKDGYIIDSLLMENRAQAIRINSKEQTTSAPIDVKVENIDVGRLITALLPDDTLHAKGLLNADISIQQPIRTIPVLTGNIQAKDLSVLDIPLGDLQFHSTNIGDSIDVKGQLSGANQVLFAGRMHLTNGGIAMQAHLQKFDAGIIRSFTKDLFNRFSTTITGDIKAIGMPDSLKYQGAVYIDSTAFALKAFNTLYRIDKQKLSIDYPALGFEKFTMTDSAGHPMTVHGKVDLFDPVKKNIDLNIETRDFIALQTTRQPGTLLYGTGIIDAALKVKGTLDNPVVEGNAGLQGKSNVHVVSSPKRNYSRTQKSGIIFVKMDTLVSTKASIDEALDSISIVKPLKQVKYNLALKVAKEAEFSVLVNPATGDELVIQGDAQLNLGLDENGKAGIEGVYNLQSGYYKMNNLLFRGKFMLVKGSSVSFNGDPEKAELNVTTEYTIETSPKPLLNDKNEGNSDYSQRVPFAVVLMVKGTVAKPLLSFDIQLKQGKAILKSSVKSDIEHALNRLRSDVTEMNKQVFSLLLAKRFTSITDYNTLESSNLNANNALKEGVSSFLTSAMDQVADQLIKNVDVDVSMKTYKTENDPTTKTDLGVAMSKDLFEDRLVIRIEESFAMGNQASQPVKSGNQYIPDITSTYKLSKDGRFQLKAYNKNEYDAVVQGYFTEVGINFTIELTYDKFKELMRRKKNQPNKK